MNAALGRGCFVSSWLRAGLVSAGVQQKITSGVLAGSGSACSAAPALPRHGLLGVAGGARQPSMARAVILLTGSLALCENSVTPQHLQRMTELDQLAPTPLGQSGEGW
jgi:hypothetical protein